jgi:RecA/RadA recombinase
MSSFLKSLQKKIGNKNASIVSDGIVGDLSGFIDTGSFLLNVAVSGSMFKGFPDNKISSLAGPPGVGKSFILLTMISRFLQKYPKGTAVFFESESAQRQDTMEGFGIDTSRVLFVPVTTVQELRGQALQILEEYEKILPKERMENKMFLCLDSLGNLSTSKEMGDSVEGKETQDMTRAKLIKSAFRVLTLKLGVLGVPFVVTNHIYMSQGLYPQAVVGGGTGSLYNSSTICMLSKRKEKEGTDFVGNVVHCKMDKSRFTKEGSTVDILINFSTGLSLYHGILDEMVSAGLVKSTGTRFEFPGSDTKVFRKEVNRNPEKYFSQELMEKLDVVLAKKFLYGSVLSSQGIELEEEDVDIVEEEDDLI